MDINMSVKDYLEEWGLQKYVDKFEEEEVDMDAFLALTPDIIKTLIPKAGPQAKLLAKLQTLKQNQQSTASTSHWSGGVNASNVVENQQLLLNDLLALVDDVPANTVIEVDVPVTNDQPESNSKQRDTQNKSDSSNTRKNTLEAHPPVQHASPGPSRSETLTLEYVLKSSLQGRLLLKAKDAFDESSRRKLANLIVENEFKGDLQAKIPHIRFKELSEEIVTLFPGEDKDTYYIPYVRTKTSGSGKGKNILARGKLIDRYYNLKRAVRKAGIAKQEESADSPDDQDSDEPADGNDIEGKLEWLKVCTEPWSQVCAYWGETSSHRVRLLQREESNNNSDDSTFSPAIIQYLDTYKALLQPLGYTLLEIDFKVLYPGTETKLLSHWAQFRLKLQSLLSKAGKQANGDEVEDESDASLLMRFADVINPTNIRQKGTRSTVWRPTREEIREGFLVHVTVPGDIKPTITRLKEKAKNRKQTVQPFALIVGKDLEHIDDAYVIINEKLFRVESPLRAVDVTFKTFHSLHLQYPRQSEALWLLLQKAVFGINTRWDRKLTAVTSLTSALRCV